MSSFWNLINVGLIAAGQKPLGAVGSLLLVAIMLGMAVVLLISVRRLPWLYAATSLFLGMAALSSIYSAWTGVPETWPSPFFRVFGALINLVGVIGFGLACRRFLRSGLNGCAESVRLND